ncbi:MAG: 3-deoxy-D-manno-octulosonic acid transferase [Paracoccaceae bacterium]
MLLYRLLLTLAAPFIALGLARRDRRAGLDERLGGHGPGAARRGAVIWLHAASNGELTAARPLIDALLARDARLWLVITCNSATGRALAQGWGLPRTEVRLAPLDYRLCLRRFLGNWQPDALIIIENELWPNRIAEMARLRRPVLVLSARMSEKSARTWARLPWLTGPVMGGISLLSAQDAGSEARFLSLGLPPERLAPALNLKTGAAPAADSAELDRLRPLFPREATLLAASTHEGEEGPILMGFRRALAQRPDLRLILAPRHPRRSPDIQAILRKQGLGFALRSAGELPEPETPVYLADTLGEMGLWYALAGTTFVGGSLVDRGGHTPFEPAAHGCALLHGPHVENFAEVYATLQAEGGSRCIRGADDLLDALLGLDDDTRARMAGAAARVTERLHDSAGLAPLIDRLAALTGDTNLRAPQTGETP